MLTHHPATSLADSTLLLTARLTPVERSPFMVLAHQVAQALPGVLVRLSPVARLADEVVAATGRRTTVVPLSLVPQSLLARDVEQACGAAPHVAVSVSGLGADGTLAVALGGRLRAQGLDGRHDVCLVVAPFGWEADVAVSLDWAVAHLQGQLPGRVRACRADELVGRVAAARRQTCGHVVVVPWELVGGPFTAALRRELAGLGVPVLEPVGVRPETTRVVAAAHRRALLGGGAHRWEPLSQSA